MPESNLKALPTEKRVDYIPETSENYSGKGSHREILAVYNNITADEKAELVQEAFDAAIETTGIESLLEAKKLPNKWEDVAEPTEPQFFYKPVGNSKQVQVVLRLNNGHPNTLILANITPGPRGEFELGNEDKGSLFHVTTQEEHEKAGQWWRPQFYSETGRWMRGKITTEQFKRELSTHRETIDQYWAKRDEKLERGENMEKAWQARHNLERVFEEAAQHELINMWEEKDKEIEEREYKIRKTKVVAKRNTRLVLRAIRDLIELDAQLPENLKSPEARRLADPDTEGWEYLSVFDLLKLARTKVVAEAARAKERSASKLI